MYSLSGNVSSALVDDLIFEGVFLTSALNSQITSATAPR